jgi:hypothetical protein
MDVFRVSVAPVRRHDDEIAALLLGRNDNGLIGLLVLNPNLVSHDICGAGLRQIKSLGKRSLFAVLASED